jgi:hypothetical protein
LIHSILRCGADVRQIRLRQMFWYERAGRT